MGSDFTMAEEALAEAEAVILRPRGPIRGRDGDRFRERVEDLAGESRSVLIDFSGVDSIDSSGLGFLLQVHDRLKAKDGHLALAELTPSVRVVMGSIGLLGFFAVWDTVDEAEAALEAGSDVGSPASDVGSLDE